MHEYDLVQYNHAKEEFHKRNAGLGSGGRSFRADLRAQSFINGFQFKKYYADKPARKNLYSYFVETKLSNIQFPNRPFYTTNDPVLTPELLDYFFNEKTITKL